MLTEMGYAAFGGMERKKLRIRNAYEPPNDLRQHGFSDGSRSLPRREPLDFAYMPFRPVSSLPLHLERKNLYVADNDAARPQVFLI